MQDSVVAGRYASAFFSVIEAGQGVEGLRKVATVLEAFTSAVKNCEELALLIKDPVLGVPEKKEVVKKILEKLDASQLVCQFFFLLLDKKRLQYISAIYTHFSNLLDKIDNISRGLLTTAIQIDEARQLEIVQTLEKQMGRKLVLDFAVDSQILGGTVLKIGDIILDSSLSTQLDKLSKTIKMGGGE